MNIGQAAASAAVTRKMIRHYEALGLVQSERQPNNYRSYSERTVSMLRFIRHARELAVPLPEVREMLGLWRDVDNDPDAVQERARAEVERLERKAASLQAVAGALRNLAETAERGKRPAVPHFEDAKAPTSF
ncbi:MerR family transcriptional regulator [Sabulicella rubraurantiaca]|uniref:MerR family transcriptional regulator n=1 Tax=Sabulicella rubraurantiaca TaxID=2811429 RepID=UPI001A960CCC|nr:MerR family transcriptional regulator [Sabulicella rubraurantiaca]